MERQLPKNVRQIGNVSDSSKIYVEDYVDTFFNQLCEKVETGVQGAFLVGETVREDDQDYIYVYGAIRMQDLEIKGKDFVVTEDTWKKACETCKEFFGNAEILGWFITGDDIPKETNHNINKIHQKFFPREKSIFVTKSTRDKEEKFYIYKYKNMMECGGHYIYYEKNAEMQNYMISIRKKSGFIPSEIIDDRVTKNFRSLVQEKIDKKEKKSSSRFVYAASTFLVLVIVVIGVTMINNYDKIKSVQNSFNEFATNKGDKDNKEDDTSIEVSGDIVNSETPNKENEGEKPGEEIPKEDEPSGNESDANAPDVDTPDVDKPSVDEPDVDKPNADNLDSDKPDADNPDLDEPVTSEPNHEVYVVLKGDTLESISREVYGDSLHVNAICKLNGLEDGNLIYIGQKLLLP